MSEFAAGPAGRIERVRALMVERGYDAIVVRDEANLRWLTGVKGVFDYTFEFPHAAFITADQCLFHTDSRYLNSFENQSYGFNRGQYIEVTEALPGVGGCKPYRAWKGPGTVKLVITGSDYQPPSDTLINTVQTTIDPTQNSGDGIGLAPIDHEVTVVGAAGTTVNISTTLTFASGWNLTECLPYIQSALDAYYIELNSTWSKEAGLIVRVSQIESRLLALAGIVDISGTTLNGQAGNLTLDKDAVAVRGSFTNA